MSVLPLLRSTGTLTHLLRHVLLYVPLVRAAAGEYRLATARRLACLFGAACAALASVIVGASWLVLSAWQQQYRHWLLGGALALLVLVCALLLRLALGGRTAGPHGTRLRAELTQDHALLQEWQRLQ
jgi:hypothetical protein